MKKPTVLLVSLCLVAFVSSQNVFLSSDLFGNSGGGTSTPIAQPSSIITLPSDNHISTVANDFGSFTLNLANIPSLNPTETSNPTNTESIETTETPEVSSIFDNVNTQPIWTPPTTSEAEIENIIESPIIEESTPEVEITPEQENIIELPITEGQTPEVEITPEQENPPIPPVNEEAFIEAPAITFTPENEVVLGEEILVAQDIGSLLETPVVTAAEPTETAPSTVQCSFTADGQIVCQTCYYQAGCNDPTTCPIDHCE